MNTSDFTTAIRVDKSPEAAFNAINDVKGWWTGNFEGQAEKPNGIFTVRFGETFITVKVVELIPYSKIAWEVIDCYKHWLKDKKEWKDTVISWEISTEANATQINFTHIGLLPGIECYEGCEKAWNFYVKESLFKLLTDGKGMPEPK